MSYPSRFGYEHFDRIVEKVKERGVIIEYEVVAKDKVVKVRVKEVLPTYDHEPLNIPWMFWDVLNRVWCWDRYRLHYT